MDARIQICTLIFCVIRRLWRWFLTGLHVKNRAWLVIYEAIIRRLWRWFLTGLHVKNRAWLLLCSSIMFHDAAQLLRSCGRVSHDESCAISLRDMQDLRSKSWFCFAERICPADRLTVLRTVTILASLGSRDPHPLRGCNPVACLLIICCTWHDTIEQESRSSLRRT